MSEAATGADGDEEGEGGEGGEGEDGRGVNGGQLCQRFAYEYDDYLFDRTNAPVKPTLYPFLAQWSSSNHTQGLLRFGADIGVDLRALNTKD